MGVTRNSCKILAGRLERRRALVKSKDGWEDCIKINLKDVGYEVLCWIQLVQGRDQWRALVNTVMYIHVSYKAGSFLTAERQLASQGGLHIFCVIVTTTSSSSTATATAAAAPLLLLLLISFKIWQS
jgi:hypothetical protein